MVHLKGILLCALAAVQTVLAKGPFFQEINATTHVIGNDLWNITIGRQYGVKLFYKNKDIVGPAVGHYVSYSMFSPPDTIRYSNSERSDGAASDLSWTSAAIYSQTPEFLDVVFTANEGDFHWVISKDLAGAYQYFVNHALPILGEFRTLFRLDNTTFFTGKTAIKDTLLPTLADIANSTKVQDETWQRPDGTYITKYDFTDFIRGQDYYGVYGPGYGSWYIVPGKDDYNGNQ
jgi:rhamnogalacturonan endolyase